MPVFDLVKFTTVALLQLLQAILLTSCLESLSSDPCARRCHDVLEAFEQGVMELVKEGINPLKEQGHSTDELLTQQVWH